jgi:hypothetical protein
MKKVGELKVSILIKENPVGAEKFNLISLIKTSLDEASR